MKLLFNFEKLICLTVFFIPLYLVKISFWGVPFNWWEVLVLAIIGLWVFVHAKEDVRNFLILPKRYWWPLGLIFSGVLISALAGDDYRTSFGIIKGWFVIPFLFAFLILFEIKTKKSAEKVLKTLFYSGGSVAIISLFYLVAGDLTYDGRLKAFYLSPNHLAMYLSPALIAGIWYLIVSINNQRSKSAILLLIAYHLSIITALFFTYSHGAWVATLVAFSSYFVFWIKEEKRRKLLIVSFGVFIVFLLSVIGYRLSVISDDRSSLSSRVVIWQSSVKILSDNWLWGIGPGNFQDRYLEYQKFFPPYLEWAAPQPHNLYLAFWLQSGLLGLVGFLWLMLIWLKDIIINSFEHPMPSWISAALLGIALYFLIHGLVDTPYWKNDLSAVFWIVIILGIKITNNNFLVSFFGNKNISRRTVK